MGGSRRRKLSFESALLSSLNGAAKHHARYRAGEAEDGEILNWLGNFLNFQGMLIAHLAMEPETSKELIAACPHAGERVPAWMELRIFGTHPQPARMFALGCAQLIASQREAIERIANDQIEDPEPIEEMLAERPVPTGDEGETARELMAACTGAFHANFQACLEIARDLDEWIEEELSEGWIGEDLDELVSEFDDELDEEYDDEYE
jgi:hypothetical protein